MATIQRSTPSGSASSHQWRRDDHVLLWAATFFTAAVLIHGGDHVRRGAHAVNLDVFWLGTAAITLEVGVVVLACQRHRLAPLAATAAGFSLALGYLAVHFLPERSWLSDSFTSGVHVSPLSWAAASLEVVAAVALGVTGFIVLRHRGGVASVTRPDPSQQRLRSAVTHPVALAMIFGNAAILAVSATQLTRP